MRTAEFHDAIGRLERATQRLQEAWADTRKAWDDPVADDFELRHLEPILPQLRFTVAAVRQLSDTFTKAARECADPESLYGTP